MLKGVFYTEFDPFTHIGRVGGRLAVPRSTGEGKPYPCE